MQISKITGNTLLQSLFVAQYFLELLSNPDLSDIELTTYHNLGGRDYGGSVFRNNKDTIEIQSTYNTLELIGNIFKLDDFRVEKELTKDLIFKYKIYSGKWIRYQIVINLSEKLYLNKNKPSNPVAINSYFSNNLFDKADNNGKLKFRNYNMSSDFLVECHRNSITFTTYIID